MVMSIDPQGCEDVDDAISIQRLDSGNIEAALWNRNRNRNF
jgi:exoribonuclease R